ncbi:MAG: thiol-disulfide oxidoreductase DCC family protein [Hyphomicrobiaceae bacterium]
MTSLMTGDLAAYSYRDDPSVPAFPDDRPIIVFDGHCVLCSGWAQFVIKRDRAARFRLLAAQTPLGAVIYEHYGLDATDYETNILIEDGIAWFKSESTIRILVGLGLPYSLVRVLRVLPLALRDRSYNVIARNRFRLFGRSDACFRPTPETQERFLPGA